MLSDFFRINMPYGMARNENEEWMFFNREYMPLGWNTKKPDEDVPEFQYPFAQLPIHTKYKGLGEITLLKLAHSGEEAVRRNDEGKIVKLFFYNDSTNPQSSPQHWNKYLAILKALSKCEVKFEYA